MALHERVLVAQRELEDALAEDDGAGGEQQAMPSETEIRCVISALRFGGCERIRMVIAAAGMLPHARRPTICQSMALRLCTDVPPVW